MRIVQIVDRLARIERIATRGTSWSWAPSRNELLTALEQCREETALLRVDIEIAETRGTLAQQETT